MPLAPIHEREIPIQVPPEKLSGRFCNFAQVFSTPEEFILDLIALSPVPLQALLIERVVMTPGHAKRLRDALTLRIQDYENQFGTINTQANDPPRILFEDKT